MVKIVFVNAPMSLEERYDKVAKAANIIPNLGLCYLATVARQEGHEVKIIDAAVLGMNHKGVVDIIEKIKPDYVGLTATTSEIKSVGKLAKMLKEVNKDIKILVGGPHMTACPEETMKEFPYIDVGIISEGEETLVELLKNSNLKNIKGITYRDKNIVVNPRREFIEDLDKLPFPAWDLLPKLTKYYKPAPHYTGRYPSTSLITSRGCPGRCIFCDKKIFGRVCRENSAKYVIRMIKHLIKNYGIKDVAFFDDTFTAFPQRLVKLCNLMIKEKLDITWSCFGRVNTVTPEILKLMKKAGCWQISYGIESGSQKVLDFLKKDIKVEQILKAIKWTRQAGIYAHGFFILGSPIETKETIKETVDLIKKVDLSSIQLTFFTPYPGTEIYPDISKYGQYTQDWENMTDWNLVFVPDGFTKEELIGYYKKILKRFYLRPRILISFLVRAFRSTKHFKAYLNAGLSFLSLMKKEFKKNSIYI